MRIAANLGVKDEIELIDATINHLRAIGVDIIIACDMGSTDGTLDVLERYRSKDDFWILQLDEQTTTEDWSRANLELIRKANVDWVVFLDADEYLLPAAGSLRECEALVNADVVAVDAFNIPLGPDGPLMPNRLTPSGYGELSLVAKPMEMNRFRCHLQENPKASFIQMEWPAKMMARPERIAAVGDGAHSVMPVEGAILRSVEPADLLIAHLPFSTRSRFARKIANIRRVFEIHDAYMGPDIGWHWRHWLALADQGRFDEEFDRNVFDAETIAALRARDVIRSAHEIFRDRMRDEKIRLYGEITRMRDHEIPRLNQRLAECDRQVAALNRASAEREQEIAVLRAAVAARDVQIATDNDRLAAVYASTLWQSTEPVRVLASRLPSHWRRQLRRAAQAVWWVATPWRIPQRLARAKQLAAGALPGS